MKQLYKFTAVSRPNKLALAITMPRIIAEEQEYRSWLREVWANALTDAVMRSFTGEALEVPTSGAVDNLNVIDWDKSNV